MNSFKFVTGNHVLICNEGKSGILLYECKEPLNTWSVLIKDKNTNKIIIKLVNTNEIKPYENTCWNCGHELNGVNDLTCPNCHWTTCPVCGKCRKPVCEDNNIVIEANYNQISQQLTIWNDPFKKDNTSTFSFNKVDGSGFTSTADDCIFHEINRGF